MGFLSDVWGGITGSNARKGAQQAGQAEREGIQKAQDFYTERDALGNQLGDRALGTLGDIYGGDINAQQGLIDRAMGSPMYSQQMGFKQDAEEALLRQGSATGGLRSGNIQDNMYKSNLRYDQSALAGGYQDQLQGLSGLVGQRDRYTGQIGQGYTDIGRSHADQAVAVADAKNSAFGNVMGLAGMAGSFMGMPSLGGGGGGGGLPSYAPQQSAVPWAQPDAFGTAGFSGGYQGTPPMQSAGNINFGGMTPFSDSRLKDGVKFLGKLNGHRIYKWLWNGKAKELGLSGEGVGVMAHQSPKEALSVDRGYLQVNYDMLGLDSESLNAMVTS